MAGGFGIWATHFVAMLAFEPGLASGYHLGLTALSLVHAIVLTGTGLATAQLRSLPAAPVLGGIVLGGGIAAMHYTGMAAYEVAEHIQRDSVLVAASLVLGSALGAAGLSIAPPIAASAEACSAPSFCSSRSAATTSPRWAR